MRHLYILDDGATSPSITYQRDCGGLVGCFNRILERMVVFSTSLPAYIPRITIRIRCEYPDTPLDPTEVTFGLSPRYGIHNAREAHDWFLSLMQSNEEFVPHFVACFLRV